MRLGHRGCARKVPCLCSADSAELCKSTCTRGAAVIVRRRAPELVAATVGCVRSVLPPACVAVPAPHIGDGRRGHQRQSPTAWRSCLMLLTLLLFGGVSAASAVAVFRPHPAVGSRT